MKSNIKIFLLFIILGLMSCEKDSIIVNTTVDIPEPEIIKIETSLVIYVEDNWGSQPRAFVTINGETTETDERGRAFIKLNSVKAKGDLVTIEADNRIKLTKRILLQPGAKNIQHVYLERINKWLNAQTDETVTVPNSKFQLSIPPNSLQYKDGSGNYSGDYVIEYEFYAGDDPDLNHKMPGDLLNNGINGDIRRLENYGMLKVNLIAPDGSPLDIAPGKKVNISFKLSNEQLINAPSEIPTFWLDEASGFWQEEGKAILSSNEYTFEVEHFTWWACNLYQCIEDIIILNGTLLLDDGSVCGGCQVELIGDDASITLNTGSAGNFSILSCPDETYELIGFYRGINCDSNEGYSLGNYSVASEDIDWGDIIIDDPDIISISGTIYTCEPGETEEGSFLIIDDSQIIETYDDGLFSFLACYEDNSNLVLEGFNEAGTLMSDAISLDIEPSGHSGLEMSTCLESDVYLDIYRDGELVQHLGRIVQDKICQEENKICISVGKEYFDDEYFSTVLEFIELVDLNQIVTYEDLEVTASSTILYSEDVHNNINNYIGLIDTIELLEVLEFGEYKTVYLKFQALAGPDSTELNYELEFRIKVL